MLMRGPQAVVVVINGPPAIRAPRSTVLCWLARIIETLKDIYIKWTLIIPTCQISGMWNWFRSLCSLKQQAWQKYCRGPHESHLTSAGLLRQITHTLSTGRQFSSIAAFKSSSRTLAQFWDSLMRRFSCVPRSTSTEGMSQEPLQGLPLFLNRDLKLIPSKWHSYFLLWGECSSLFSPSSWEK